MGTGEIGVPALKALAERHDVVAVYTQPDRPAGRDLKLRASPVKVAALALGIPVLQPEKVRTPEAVAELEAFGAEVIVVAAYGQILPKRILELPKYGCLNIHASILPRHRGASPIHSAILAGDAESGVTIMQMDVGLDTGDMLDIVRTPIAADDTAGSLHDRMAGLAAEPLLAVIEELAAGTATPEKQNASLATYASKLTKQDGHIDWSASARDIDLRLRGMTPWPGAFTALPDGRTLKIHRAAIEEGSGGEAGEILSAAPDGILIAAGSGRIRLLEVQAAGGKRLAAADFLRGNALAPGSKLG